MTVRILVCDDHPVVLDAIEGCLRAISPDCEIGLCGTAREAVARLAAPGWWDLVVLDLTLPDARGIEALIRVRARAPDTRVAVLSAADDRETVERSMRAGAIAFLPKNADRGRLLESLRRALELPAAEPRPAPGSVRMSDAEIHEAISTMSPRQLQVLRLLVRGLPNKEICRELDVTENTIKIHIGAVLRALCSRTRTEAVARAGRIGFGAGH
jgi:DNA-binding NarL/FixJ family response regulator